MATMTINLQENTIQKFRNTVKKEYGEGKGKLGKAVEEALEHWIREKEQEEIAERQLRILRSGGLHIGKIKKYTRGELHERK